MGRLCSDSLIFFFVLTASQPAGAAQASQPPPQAMTSTQVKQLGKAIAKEQATYLIGDAAGLRYRFYWKDQEHSQLTEVIGSSAGHVSRLLEVDGRELDKHKDEAERGRLQALLEPGRQEAAHKSATRLQQYFVDMIGAMPEAMVYRQAADQSAIVGTESAQIILDYAPNPAFHPHSLAEGTLTKLSGRIWIDSADWHLQRMTVHLDDDVTLAGGLLIKVFAGGDIDYRQQRVGQGQYLWSRIVIHLRMRELLVRSTRIDAELTASGVQQLPSIPSASEAIHSLLLMQVPSL